MVAQERRSDSKGNEVAQRIELAPEGTGGIQLTGNSSIQPVKEDCECNALNCGFKVSAYGIYCAEESGKKSDHGHKARN